MKIPANGASRLSKETWMEAEILRRYKGADNIRKVIEAAVSEIITKHLGDADPDFIKVMQEVRQEGIEQ